MAIIYLVEGRSFLTLEEAEAYDKQAPFRKQLKTLLDEKIPNEDCRTILMELILNDAVFAERLIALISKVIY